MKKHLIFASALLLTTGTAKLGCMETNQLTTEQENNISQAINTLRDLANVSQEIPFSSPEVFLPALSNFINTTKESSKLRKAIFAITSIDLNLPKNLELTVNPGIIARKAMYNRLIELLEDEKKISTKEAKREAKELCFGILNDISDNEENDEDKNNNFTRRNYNKYQLLNELAQKTLLDQKIFSSKYTTLKKTKEDNDLRINHLKDLWEKAQKENSEFEQQINDNQTEIELLEHASNILNLKKSEQMKKMEKQKEWLTKKIDALSKDIKELSTTTENTKENTEQLTKKQTKFTNLQNALSILNRDFANIEGQTGTFRDILWNIKLYDYSNALKKN